MIGEALGFLLKNFSAPITFYISFHIWGAKAAIGSALAITFVILGQHLVRRTPPSPFFLVASFFTISFGTLDLLIETPRYFRFEPFAQNALMGTVFLFMQLARVPVAAWFMKGLPAAAQLELVLAGTNRPHEANHAYLRKLTWVWMVYMYLKSAVFLWLAFRLDLGDLILLRSVIGGGSLAILIVGEITYRTRFRQPHR